jgi:hypothetical protein|tara:strand:+ start:2511 stop:2657 length:147 start_codon:yes stop_codon:yes gene_type:complete
MIENILQMLEIAKEQKEIGKLTHIALGKNKYPDSIKEAYEQFKIELCQ